MPGPVSEAYQGPADPPVRTPEDVVELLGDLVEDGIFEGIIGLDDERTVPDGARLVALVPRDEDEGHKRIRLRIDMWPSESALAGGIMEAHLTAALRVARELSEQLMRCGHTIGDLIGAPGYRTKCGACMHPDELARFKRTRDVLASAVRRFTVDAPDDQPNGPAEQAIEELRNALDPLTWGKRLAGLAVSPQAMDEIGRSLREANAAASRLCEALDDNTKALRLAAEAFFGGDFRARALPEVPHA